MKNYYLRLIAAVLFIITSVPVHSDDTHPHGITLDGTLGTAGKLALPGPDFDVKAEYGTQAGTNLFHSFQKFNIHSNESATFSGPGSVQNIIGRVTGGDISWIDGTLRSTIPGADLYLLNPAG
ncbi:MAG: filamentous hemagglutinin N-terminal domain-containing protein, partial [Desulfobacteraceae bacterium]|nr:filamentous hemagglutinin N-terminal domain-containing protein [Desulfobacteraceae bacterium]